MKQNNMLFLMVFLSVMEFGTVYECMIYSQNSGQRWYHLKGISYDLNLWLEDLTEIIIILLNENNSKVPFDEILTYT